MESRTLRVGSLVEYGKGKAMVIGCTFEEAANKMVKKYLVVPYPAGYTGKDSLHVIDAKNAEPFLKAIMVPSQGHIPNIWICWNSRQI